MRSAASHHLSPLRYPGGKAKLSSFFKDVIRRNSLLDCCYVEPFAGGAGVALSLLLSGYVRRVVINDADFRVYAIWRAILDEPERFQQSILKAELSVDEWQRQRQIFFDPQSSDLFDVGFATFYLNRTNRSGVLNGGMIGGYAQTSVYGLDARFNKQELASRVGRIARVRQLISARNEDAAETIRACAERGGAERHFIYADPPYYKKGPDLYYRYFADMDHKRIADEMSRLPRTSPWIVSYDNAEEVRTLYEGYRSVEYDLSYSVTNGRSGREIMFLSPQLLPIIDVRATIAA